MGLMIMTRMLDAWHDRYHVDQPEPRTCVYCYDELVARDMSEDAYAQERDALLAELHAYWDRIAEEWTS